MHKIVRALTGGGSSNNKSAITSTTTTNGNDSPQQQRRSESESEFRSSIKNTNNNRSTTSNQQSQSPQGVQRQLNGRRVSSSSSDLNNNGTKGGGQSFNSSSTDRAKALDGDEEESFSADRRPQLIAAAGHRQPRGPPLANSTQLANKEESWEGSSDLHGSAATDDDIGDVWDEELEEAGDHEEADSFDEDEVDGFNEEEHDDDELEDDEGRQEIAYDHHSGYVFDDGQQYDGPEEDRGVQQPPPPTDDEPVQAGASVNIWNLEDIPEEEAAELMAVVAAAEEYLSSVASVGVGPSSSKLARIQRSISLRASSSGHQPAKKQRSAVEMDEEEEEAGGFPTASSGKPAVGVESSLHGKQKHQETGGATAANPIHLHHQRGEEQRSRRDNKCANTSSMATTTRSHRAPPAPLHAQGSLEGADSLGEISNISMDSVSSSRNRSYRGNNAPPAAAPQLNIFSVGETKFPDSPTSSRRDTLSNASQSSRVSGRSARSLDRASLLSNGSRNHSGEGRTSHFKVAKSIKLIQLDSNGVAGHPPSKLRRTSPPPPGLHDFRPGTPPDEEVVAVAPVQLNGVKNGGRPGSPSKKSAGQNLDSACLSKLATDIERLLAQLDNDVPEEKIRFSTLLKSRERIEDAECTLDKKDFRKCYRNVLAVDTGDEDDPADEAKPIAQPSPMFLSPRSDADLTFYSGDDGEASLIGETSAHGESGSASMDDGGDRSDAVDRAVGRAGLESSSGRVEPKRSDDARDETEAVSEHCQGRIEQDQPKVPSPIRSTPSPSRLPLGSTIPTELSPADHRITQDRRDLEIRSPRSPHSPTGPQSPTPPSPQSRNPPSPSTPRPRSPYSLLPSMDVSKHLSISTDFRTSPASSHSPSRSPSAGRFLASFSPLQATTNRFSPTAENDGGSRFQHSNYASGSSIRSPTSSSGYVPIAQPRRSVSMRDSTSGWNPDNLSSDPIDREKQYLDRIRELEKLLRQERELRRLAEENEQIVRKRLEELEWKLEQAEKHAAARAELDAKREQELTRLRAEAERARREHQLALDTLRKKQAEVIACIEDQLSTTKLERGKAEKECSKLRAQLLEAHASVDSLGQEKKSLEAEKNKMELKAYEYQLKVEELQGLLAEAAGARLKLASENDKMAIQMAESQAQTITSDRKRADLQRQLDLLNSNLDEETKKRQSLTDRVKQLEKENDTLRESALHDEEKKKDLGRQLGRANTEIQGLQTKLEQCSLAQAELLEQQKNYYTNKLTQAREENETLTGRILSLERIRTQLRQEIEDLTVELEKANATMAGYDKRVMHLDKTVREWEQKYNELSKKVVAMETELHSATGELERSKRQVEEAAEEAAVLRRENQKFKEELQGLQNHVTEVTEALKQTEKLKRRLGEGNEDSEYLIDSTDHDGSGSSDIKAVIDAEVQERVIEFEEARRTLRSTIDELSARIDEETTGRECAVQQRLIVEKRVSELESLLDGANTARLDALERVKRINGQNQDLAHRIEKLKREHTNAIEKCALAEKRASVLQNEREEMAAALVQVEKSRQELIEQTSALKRDVAEHEAALSHLKVAKREVESAADDARLNLELATNAASIADEKATTTQADVESERASLHEQLSKERERATRAEQATAKLETTIKELHSKIERLERNALMKTEGAVARLEQTVRNLEIELKQERQKAHEALRAERASERMIKELQFQMEQERLQASRMADVVDNLEQKLKIYRKQRQEAEEFASAKSARCRELRHELGSVEDRADAAENFISRIRAETRGRISGLLNTKATPITTAEIVSPLTRRPVVTTVLSTSKRAQSTSTTTPTFLKSRLPSAYR